jgi:hypothetical protein
MTLHDICCVRRSNEYHDEWHLFSGADFQGGTIGCAYVNSCHDYDWGYGVNEMPYTTSLCQQAVLFAHELGRNLGLNHAITTNG